VDPRILVREVRDAMERDGRLAGARGAADHDEARRRARDQRELLRVDEAGDVGEMLVRAPAGAGGLGAKPAVRGIAGRMRPDRGALAAGEPRRLAIDAAPAAVRRVGVVDAI